MSEPYLLSAGTPVLVVGYSRFPEEFVGDLRREARMACAGTLAETWRPTQALLMEPGPLAGNLPAMPEALASLIVAGAPDRDDDRYEALVARQWRRGFSIERRVLNQALGAWESDEFGCRFYRVFEDVAGLASRLPEPHSGGDWLGLQSAMREIVAHVDWRHGSDYEGYSHAFLDSGSARVVRELP